MNEILNRCHFGEALDVLRTFPDACVNTCVTSPPYWGLRDYGHSDQLGLEATPEEYVARLVAIFREVRRVLRDDGTLWLNLGDSYAGSRKGGYPGGTGTLEGSVEGQDGARAAGEAMRTKARTPREAPPVPRSDRMIEGIKSKDLVGIPWMVAFALRADGWYLRQDIIWAKPNPMPESVRDRCTKSHEYIFLLSKGPRYYFDQEAILEPLAQASVDRLSQPTLADQAGSDRVPGKTNGAMKAVSRGPAQSFTGPKALATHPDRQTKRSGNLERKPGSARGCPEGTGSNVCGSIPWEGNTRNKRSVWNVATVPYSGAHFATFPPDLIRPCILAGAPAGGVVLDPFLGSGTTAEVSQGCGRQWIGCELNRTYSPLQDDRTTKMGLL